jgi:nuclease-like protein
MATNALPPLKDKPLRNPGQGLDERIQALLDDKLLSYFWYAAGFTMLASMEWVGYLLRSPRMPWVFTAVALLAISWAAWRIPILRREVRALRQGRDGEKAVGQFLERFRAQGAHVFHDVEGDDFNLDHVVISDRGVLIVETKALSKPHANATITVKDGRVLIAGQSPDRDPIEQLRAQSTWLARILRESTGKSFHIRGAVVFPGWFVEPQKSASKLDVWILEPKALEGFLAHEPVRLTPSDVSLAAFHLSRFIRQSQR